MLDEFDNPVIEKAWPLSSEYFFIVTEIKMV